MKGFSVLIREKRVRRLLHAVVRELVRRRAGSWGPLRIRWYEKPFVYGAPQVRRDVVDGLVHERGHEIDRKGVAYARRDLHGLLGAFGKLLQRLDQQIGHVVGNGDTFEVRKVPLPGAESRVEREEIRRLQKAEEPLHEEGIARCLFLDQPGQGARPRGIAPEHFREELRNRLDAERPQLDFLHGCAGLSTR